MTDKLPLIIVRPQVNSPYSKFLASFTRFRYSKMNSTVDYTPVLLAQLTDLQMRVTKQEATITALKAEVERLTGHSVTVNDTMRTSVPLRNHTDTRDAKPQRPARPTTGRPQRPAAGAGAPSGGIPRRPKIAPTTDKPQRPTMSLSDVLKEGENVTIQVGTGKDSEGNFTNTTAEATFDGTDLVVNECELVESLVGMKSSKPGEILYKFIDELKSAGHIKRTFTIAPWRLCFVERNGVKKSLEELRTVVG